MDVCSRIGNGRVKRRGIYQLRLAHDQIPFLANFLAKLPRVAGPSLEKSILRPILTPQDF